MAVLGLFSVLCFLVFLGLLVYAFIKRKRKRVSLIGMAVSFAILILALALTPSTPNDTVSQSPAISSSSSSENIETATPMTSPSTTVTQTPPPTPSISGELVINYLNVGQGDSEFIELPNGQTMLIDAGYPRDGANIVQYIKDKGYSKIDWLIATHPHADHIGGMTDVINGIKTGTIYMPKIGNNTQTFEELLNTIKAKGLPVNAAKAGVSLVDSADLKANMIAPNSSNYEDLNNYSDVVKITYKKKSFLFMGDAQTLSENEILKAGDDVKADVLKVGHHGSNTSTGEDFLNRVSPKYAVISCGKGNSYDHPTQATLDKLNVKGTKVYRTDQNGTIVMTSDGANITVQKSDFATAGWLNGAGNSEEPSPSMAPPNGSQQSGGNVGISNVDKVGEIVTINNAGSTDINMTGWVLLSVTGNQRFTFPSYTLLAGSSVTIASGKSNGDLKWTDKNVWNNETNDPAELYDSTGNLVSSYGS